MYKQLRILLRRGAIIGSSRDTGYDVYKKFAQTNKSECLIPVFKANAPSIKPEYLAGKINLFFEYILPEKLCYLPKRRNYFSGKGFKESGLKDLYEEGWDEFMWKDEPFGFHVQGAKKEGGTVSSERIIPDF